MGREYKIYKTDLWYSIYRKKQEGKLLYIEYLNSHNIRSWNKTNAKTFYTKESAVSALVIEKSKWRKTESTSSQTTNSWGKREKSCWAEF